MGDPDKAVDTILEAPFTLEGITFYPLTLARYANFEKIKSPFLFGGNDIEAVIATIFIMACPIEELKALRTADQIFQAAVEWADGLPPGKLETVIQMLTKQLMELSYVAPNSAEEESDKKKLPTDS